MGYPPITEREKNFYRLGVAYGFASVVDAQDPWDRVTTQADEDLDDPRLRGVFEMFLEAPWGTK